ncbi:MAG: glutamine-hydrolyzing carbamoyl-phosphate synthase small subunit [Thalassospira sp.]|nr:glutamine-hydrolyzing carbamoyl-phosphate synthase small subunit [Thalassospira sp.]
MIDRHSSPNAPTGALLFPDGTLVSCIGFGKPGVSAGEICFNTAMTGYQEVLTDPSFAGQIITFTFPHIGNVGTNDTDLETEKTFAKGLILREFPSMPSNYRAADSLVEFCRKQHIQGIAGIDTRALTNRIRARGAVNVAIGYFPDGRIDRAALTRALESAPEMNGLDLVPKVTRTARHPYDRGVYDLAAARSGLAPVKPVGHVVAYDFGAKENILRCLVSVGFRVTVVPANTKAAEVMALKPDGIFFSNGPGDPAATYDVMHHEFQALLASNVPLFGICLGFQLLALALGGKTFKLPQGHRGANHPVLNRQTGKVEITSQNHGFAVEPSSLPKDTEITHVSLFDGTLEGFRHKTRPLFAVQYHPEASPGPQESFYLFEQFRSLIQTQQAAA